MGAPSARKSRERERKNNVLPAIYSGYTRRDWITTIPVCVNTALGAMLQSVVLACRLACVARLSGEPLTWQRKLSLILCCYYWERWWRPDNIEPIVAFLKEIIFTSYFIIVHDETLLSQRSRLLIRHRLPIWSSFNLTARLPLRNAKRWVQTFKKLVMALIWNDCIAQFTLLT